MQSWDSAPRQAGCLHGGLGPWLLCTRFLRLGTQSQCSRQSPCGKYLAQVIVPPGRLAEKGGWRQETGEELLLGGWNSSLRKAPLAPHWDTAGFTPHSTPHAPPQANCEKVGCRAWL